MSFNGLSPRRRAHITYSINMVGQSIVDQLGRALLPRVGEAVRAGLLFSDYLWSLC
jgi:hypothetical protein